MKNFIRFQLPILVWGVIIFLISSISRIPDLNQTVLPLDKILHLIEYFLLGFLVARGLFYQKHVIIKKYFFVVSLIIACSVGFLDEFYQYFVPNRDASPLDFLADVIGSAAAIFIFFKYFKNEKLYKENFPG